MSSTLLSLAGILLAAVTCTASESRLMCASLTQTPQALSKSLNEGNAAFEKGDLTKAEELWAKIYECATGYSEWPKAAFNLGMLEYRRKNFPQAISYFGEVLKSHPNDKEPGGNIMETNRNYSNRSAMAISQCYEAMGDFAPALRYAWLAKTKYRFYSWCGTCYSDANLAMDKRIAYLTVRVSRPQIWAGILVVGFVVRRRKKRDHTQP